MNNRRVAAAVLATALIGPALIGAFQLAGLAGIGGEARGATPGGAGAAVGGAATTADAQALREFAGTLNAPRDDSFSAQYATASGAVVTLVHEPPRRAYRSAAASYLIGPDVAYLCRTPPGEPPTCRREAGVETVPLDRARGLTGVLADDFIAPEVIASYLGRIAARPPGRVQRSERVIANQRVRCIAIPAAFTACATADGLLAHFEAPDGRLTLTGYRPEAPADAFALPRGAVVTDDAD